MTDELDLGLRDRLSALAAAVPIDLPGGLSVVTPRLRPGRTGRRIALGGLAPLLAIIVIGTVVAGLAKVGPFAPGTTDDPNHDVVATTVDGPFELSIRATKGTYLETDNVEVDATLTYRGQESSIGISHGHGSPMGFGIVERVNGMVLAPGWRLSCEHTVLARDRELEHAFGATAGFTADDPAASAYQAFFADPKLHLPAGTWHLYAVAEFYVGDCGEEKHAIRADIEIHVVVSSVSTIRPTDFPRAPTSAPATLFGQTTIAQLEWAAGMVRGYGAQHPESFAAIWIDRPDAGPVAIASSWTVDIEVHRAWMAANIGFLVPYSVFPAQFTKTELERTRDEIYANLEWLDALPAQMLELSAGGSDNHVRLAVSSAIPDAPALIQAHYSTAFGFEPGMLVVTSDGTGAYFVPWGSVKVTLNLPLSGIPAGVELMPGWRSNVNGLRCGNGDVGVGFEDLPCQEGTWTILVEAWREGDRLVVGSGVVNVKAGTTAELTIDVEPIPGWPWPSPTPAPSADG